MNIKYYIATEQEQMYQIGDILKVDLDEDFDGTPATNLTQMFNFCPFTFDGVKEISQEEAEEAIGITM